MFVSGVSIGILLSLVGYAGAGPADTSAIATPACTLGDYLIPTNANGAAKLMTYEDAALECSGAWSLGVADVGDSHRIGLGSLIKFCNIPTNGAWVNSYNGKTYNGLPLFMVPKDYSVFADITGGQVFPVICRISKSN
ncbi:C-type lectin domain-containing protein [Plasmodiophora brassicae]|uniref:C-type lectin domain-containing protein n=1 Tax=Plasmodiophora brassicae TaxID=37360 RepID=A0A0G4IR25_PLABS|nr:hypothetical protein PBRA_005942 [Plasmodiophora brassicae]